MFPTRAVVAVCLLLFTGAQSLSVGKRVERGINDMLCAAELYKAPLRNCCRIPYKLPEPALKNCLLAQKAKTMKDSEEMCTFDCTYKAMKWVNSLGEIDTKNLIASVTAGLDKVWVALMTNTINNCSKQITGRKDMKITTGYKTQCNPQSFMMQNCFILDLYKNCPKTFKGIVKTAGIDSCPAIIAGMSMTCGPFAHFSNALTDAAKNAGELLKKKAQDINAALPAEIKKAVNVGDLGKVISQNANSLQGKITEQLKTNNFFKNIFG